MVVGTKMSLDWRNVDRDPAAADRYLSVAAEAFSKVRSQAFDRLRLVAGSRVLDVGCGNGAEAERMAAMIPGGSVTAIDSSAELIALAKARTHSLGLNLDFRAADAHALPFAAGHFDAGRIERVLQHVDDPQLAVRELVRVVRPGGLVCAIEPDWQSSIFAGGDIEVERAITRYKTDAEIAHGTIGRDLPEVLHLAGCVDIVTDPAILGSPDLAFADAMIGLSRCLRGAVAKMWISPAAAKQWWNAAEGRASRGTFYAAGIVIISSGTVPEK
jgi:2-polyprenyl-3-methyl-5-hydroxy-6-metoxy-1,4-benzoquinol methylase